MRSARHVLAVTLVATAICADRATASAPVQPPVTQLASRLIDRLSVTFRRVVPAATLYQPRRSNRAVETRPSVALEPVLIQPVSLSPFQFRLPPPVR